jgi:hypothetical protein
MIVNTVVYLNKLPPVTQNLVSYVEEQIKKFPEILKNNKNKSIN